MSAGWGRTTSDVSSDDSGCDDNATDAASRRSFDSTPPGRGNAGGDETAAHSRPAAAPPPQREQPRERSQARRPVEEAAEDEACFALAAAGAREAARPALQDGARGEPRGPFLVTCAALLLSGRDVLVPCSIRAHLNFTRSC